MTAAEFAAVFGPDAWAALSAFLFKAVALGWLAGFIALAAATARPRS